MTSAKAWYWLGLGIMALSFMTSGAGRSIMNNAGAYAACIRTRALPYLGTIEMALGRTQEGYGHLQASMEQTRAQVDVQQARLEAARARMETARALQEERMQESLRKAQDHLVMQRAVLADEVITPIVTVSDTGRRVLICPHTGVRVDVPQVHVQVPNVNVEVPNVHVAVDSTSDPI